MFPYYGYIKLNFFFCVYNVCTKMRFLLALESFISGFALKEGGGKECLL